MSTSYPTSLDALTNPVGTDKVSVVDHAAQHANANDSIEALEAKVGANSSAVTTSHDYKLGEVTSSDKAVGKTANQTLTNKTLTTPTIGSFTNANHNHQDTSGGGTLAEVALALTDITTNNVSATKHGFAPKFPNNTTTFLRGDGTYATPAATGAVAISCVPPPAFPCTNFQGDVAVSTATQGRFGKIHVPLSMTFTRVTFVVNTKTVNGDAKFAIFSEDGQTQVLTFTVTVTADGLKTTTVSSTVLTPGYYYVVVVPVSTVNFQIKGYTPGDELNAYQVGSAQVLSGVKTVTSGTMPATFDPTTLTANDDCSTPWLRLDV